MPLHSGDPMQIAGDDTAFLQHFETLLNHNLIRQSSSDDVDMRFAASRFASIMQQVRHPRIHLRGDYERIAREARAGLNSKTQVLWNEGAQLSDGDVVSLAVRV